MTKTPSPGFALLHVEVTNEVVIATPVPAVIAGAPQNKRFREDLELLREQATVSVTLELTGVQGIDGTFMQSILALESGLAARRLRLSIHANASLAQVFLITGHHRLIVAAHNES